VEQSLLDELKGGIPAIIALVPAIAVIRFVCGRLGLRRLRLALSLLALAVSLLVFRRLAPTVGQPFAPYLWVVTTFAGLYFVFKLSEVLLLDVFWRRAGRAQPPAIFRDVVSTLFAAVVFVVLLQVGLDVHVAALVITSAALSIFLGLALQQSVSDLFAGVALVMERPFAPGDWVKIGERVGRVEEISWRAVRIRLQRLDDDLIVPNSVIAKADIVNMSSPTRLHGTAVEVGVAYAHPPNRVREVMVATSLEVSGVLPRPVPVAELLRFDDSAIAYRLTYWIDDLPRSIDIESSVRAHLWYAFQRSGIQIPYPTVHYYTRPLVEAQAAHDAARRERVASLFGRVDFLSVLKPDQIDALARMAPIVQYPAGAMIVKKGAEGDSLFVVASGRVEILAERAGGGPLYAVGGRDVGDFFGEMSLLTDEPRPLDVRAVVDVELVVLTRDVMRPIFVEDPVVAEHLSQALTRHLAKSKEAIEHMPGVEPDAVYPAATLLSSIRRVFGLASIPR
jgi:small-conductance mechanosensitive channel/CRP-like cAMP-binding protein